MTEKGKNKGGKNKDSRAPYFDGTCSYCRKRGHKESDCWLKASGGKRVHALESHSEPVAPGTAAPVLETTLKEVYAMQRDEWLDEDAGSPKSEDRWVLAFAQDLEEKEEKEKKNDEYGGVGLEWLMLDSGAAEHACPSWWHDTGLVRPVNHGGSLRDVQGNAIPQLGLRTVKCDVVGKEEKPTKIAIHFTVTEVREPIVSMVKLSDAGAKVHVERENSWVQFGESFYPFAASSWSCLYECCGW